MALQVPIELGRDTQSSVTSCWQLENDHSRSTHITEISKLHRSFFFLFFSFGY